MTDYIEKLKELDRKAAESAVHVINAIAEKYPLGADFERYSQDIINMISFFNEDATTRLIELLEGAEKALEEYHSRNRDGMHPNNHQLAECFSAIRVFREKGE